MRGFEENRNSFFEVVQRLIDTDKLSHAYLIEIADYENSFLAIKDFVKFILCKNKVKKIGKLNCEQCNICSLVDGNNYPDLLVIEPDGKEIKKSQILAIRSEFRDKSLLDNKRIYIIKEAEKLNVSAANALLKFLEEPEDDIIAILLTKNRYKVVETILSRCQVLSLNIFSGYLEVSDSVGTLIKYIYNSNNVFLKYNDIYTNIVPDKDEALKVFNDLNKELLAFLESSSCGDFSAFPEDIIKVLSEIDLDKLINDISIIEDFLEKLDFNINYKLWLDALFAKIMGGEKID